MPPSLGFPAITELVCHSRLCSLQTAFKLIQFESNLLEGPGPS